MRLVLLVIALLALADPRAAEACSVTRTFVAPTNLELVEQAPTIVVARVVAVRPEGRRSISR